MLAIKLTTTNITQDTQGILKGDWYDKRINDYVMSALRATGRRHSALIAALVDVQQYVMDDAAIEIAYYLDECNMKLKIERA